MYIVTPPATPAMMREHNRGAISNTCVHEAYPGHHLQLSAAIGHPSLVRLLTDAPEFVEGWGMYSEQMMREHMKETCQHIIEQFYPGMLGGVSNNKQRKQNYRKDEFHGSEKNA